MYEQKFPRNIATWRNLLTPRLPKISNVNDVTLNAQRLPFNSVLSLRAAEGVEGASGALQDGRRYHNNLTCHHSAVMLRLVVVRRHEGKVSGLSYWLEAKSVCESSQDMVQRFGREI